MSSHISRDYLNLPYGFQYRKEENQRLERELHVKEVFGCIEKNLLTYAEPR